MESTFLAVATCGGYESFNALPALKNLSKLVKAKGGEITAEHSIRLPMNNLDYSHIPVPISKDHEQMFRVCQARLEAICQATLKRTKTRFAIAKLILNWVMTPLYLILKGAYLKELRRDAKEPDDSNLSFRELIPQTITEVDISEPRRIMREHKQQTGETLSLTAYLVACLARVVVENPEMNSFRRGRKLILLSDVTIGTFIEREIDGENAPEPIGIRAAQSKTFRQIHDEIRAAQHSRGGHIGSLSGMEWIRFMPSFLLRTFIRAASHSVFMMKRYGAVSVTAVGMFGNKALWFLPLGGATVLVTVGSIVERPVVGQGGMEVREHLCLTVSFDHDITDGAPAARFVRRLSELISSGEALSDGAGGTK
jgi:hypothetical protein